MVALQKPRHPGLDANKDQLSRYRNELTDYRARVETVATEVENICRDIFNLCEELSIPPMMVMDSVSANIWEGNAAMQFQIAGGNEKRAVEDCANAYRDFTATVMNKVNSFLASI